MVRGAFLSPFNFQTYLKCGHFGAPQGPPWIYCQTRCIASSRNLGTEGVGAVKTDGAGGCHSVEKPASFATQPALYSHLIPDYQEWYIPVTRRTLIKTLLDDDRFGGISDGTRKNLKIIAAEVDAAVSIRYHQVLHELKRLYYPVNPDKEVNEEDDSNSQTRLTKEQRESSVALTETRFLTLLRKVFKEANFQQLSHESMLSVLQEHNVGDGVMVSVNPANYSTLCFWVLDRREKKAKQLDWVESIYDRYKSLTGRPTPELQDVFSRVIVAVRNKGSTRLRLKGFKDVPVGGLEQLLPGGKVRMRSFDRYLLISMCLLGSGSMAMRTSNQMTEMNIESGTLIALVISVMIGLNSYFAYGNRKNSYLLELSQMHYYKNLANNLALVTLVIDRVQDEIFKEAMLVYFHLVSHGSSGMPLVQVERLVESWTSSTLGRNIHFDSRESIELLSSMELVVRKGHLIFPVDLNSAAHNSNITDHRYFSL